jgi:hypothetical protein
MIVGLYAAFAYCTRPRWRVAATVFRNRALKVRDGLL